MGHILFVEDEEIFAKIFAKRLRTASHDVTLAANGKEGLERLMETTDLILLDNKMPIMTGEEFLAVLQTPQYSKYKHIPIIGIGNFPPNKYSRMELYRKPFKSDDLIATVAKYFKD